MKTYTKFFCLILIGCSGCRPNPGGNPSNMVWGDLVAITATADSADNLITGNSAEAAFYSSGNMAWKALVNNVAANGMNLTADDYHTYYARSVAETDTHLMWVVDGGNAVPSFSYDDVGAFPIYSGPGLPDTISRGRPFSMNFPSNTLTDADSVEVTFNKISYTSTIFHTSKPMDINRHVGFTTQDMNRLDTGDNVGTIVVTKAKSQVFGGKLYHFAKRRVYQYRVVVK